MEDPTTMETYETWYVFRPNGQILCGLALPAEKDEDVILCALLNAPASGMEGDLSHYTVEYETADRQRVLVHDLIGNLVLYLRPAFGNAFIPFAQP